MSGYSRFIIVSFLPETWTQKDFLGLCSEYGQVRNCRLQKSDKGLLCGFCEYDRADAATLAVRSLNHRSANEGSQYRASFSKARPVSRSCHLRVKFLPSFVTQDDVTREFAQFGKLTRVNVVSYERNSTAYISFETMESADSARTHMNKHHWAGNNDLPIMQIDFSSAYYSNGRKVHNNQEEDFSEIPPTFNHNAMPLEDTIVANPQLYQQNSAPQPPQVHPYYNYSQQAYMGATTPNQTYEINNQQDYQNPASKPQSVQTAQFVQLNPYSWQTNYQAQQNTNAPLVYEAPNPQQPNGLPQPTNGIANSPPVKQNPPAQQEVTANQNPQWSQFYSQLVQQMQNTHLYSNPSQPQYQQTPVGVGTFSVPQNVGQPFFLNPQPVYCATPLASAPQGYPFVLNNLGYRGVQPNLQQPAANIRYPPGVQYGPNVNYHQIATVAAAGVNMNKTNFINNRGSSNNNNNNNTLYVYNTGNSMTEDGLRALFSRFGTIVDVSVPKDPSTGASRNFGFVNYLDPASASAAIERMNGVLFYDRVLQVSYKRPRLSNHPNGQRNSSAAGKDRKENESKSEPDASSVAASEAKDEAQAYNNKTAAVTDEKISAENND